MTGIYKITNKINNKVYIGLSCRLHDRWLEHLRAAQPHKYAPKNKRDHNCPIHKAMAKYGVENFVFEIIEECDRDLLNEREQYWIKYYSAREKDKGYNLTDGGQKNFAQRGENHSQAKFSQQQIDEIIFLLKNTTISYQEIMNKFHISKPMLSNINRGKNWKKDNEIYPLRPTTTAIIGSQHSNAVLNDDLVTELRTLYSQGLQPKQINELYPNININTLRACLQGKTWKHLPIWKPKTQEWI